MANNLRKFNTLADYQAAELVKPAVSLIASDDSVYFDQKDAAFSGLTVYYNITDISAPTELFNGGGSGSGSGSGSGGVLPSAMIIDGTAVEVAATYQFDTVGEHIVNYSFADNAISEHFLDGEGSEKFSTVTKVEIGDAITSIGEYAFIWCYGLTDCTIGSGVTSIGNNAFQSCTSLTSINIPSGVTSIGNSAFYDCTSLTSIDIPSGVTTIGDETFHECNSLTSIDIPNSVTSIGSWAFSNCSGLTSVSIPDSVTSIGILAFGSCYGLTDCTIGSGVTSIGNNAFEMCSSLTSIVCNATTAPTIQSYTFYNVKTGGTLYVPQGSTGYDVWMGIGNYYLGKYGWTEVEQ